MKASVFFRRNCKIQASVPTAWIFFYLIIRLGNLRLRAGLTSNRFDQNIPFGVSYDSQFSVYKYLGRAHARTARDVDRFGIRLNALKSTLPDGTQGQNAVKLRSKAAHRLRNSPIQGSGGTVIATAYL